MRKARDRAERASGMDLRPTVVTGTAWTISPARIYSLSHLTINRTIHSWRERDSLVALHPGLPQDAETGGHLVDSRGRMSDSSGWRDPSSIRDKAFGLRSSATRYRKISKVRPVSQKGDFRYSRLSLRRTAAPQRSAPVITNTRLRRRPSETVTVTGGTHHHSRAPSGLLRL